MIVQCPKCQSELTLDMKHLDEDTALVCRGCRSILKTKIVVEILVEKGGNISKSSPPQNARAVSPERSMAAAATPARMVQELREDIVPVAVDPQKVLIAIDGEGTKEMIKELLSGASFKVVEANSGNETLALLNRQRPAIALIDVGLPDGLGSELCSTIKKDDRLKETIVILMASIYEKNNKYRRQPSSLFGADDYIERHHVEKDLLVRIRKHLSRKQNDDSPAASPAAETSVDPVLRETSMPSLEETARARRPEEESIPPAIDRGRTLDVEQSTRPALEESAPPPAIEPVTEKAPEPKEHEDARRLARIIVSDIVLYNKKKVEEGIRSDRFYELLKEEIEEGRKHYDSRVPPEVQKVRDFYKEAFDDFIRKKKG